jgi:hypothetical protein
MINKMSTLGECHPMILVHIVNQLPSPQDILALCQVNRHVHQVTKLEEFWTSAVANRFPSQGRWKPHTISWREYYLELVWSVATGPQVTYEAFICGGSVHQWIFRGQRHRLNDLPAVIYPDRRQEYGEYHRDGDQPAIIDRNKIPLLFPRDQDQCVSQDWYQHGLLHRDGDQPAAIDSNGHGSTLKWCQHGLLHRDGDRPALIEASGGQSWYQKGQHHREGDQPAIIDPLGQIWCRWGQKHREGGQPAVIHADGRQEWWLNGTICLVGDTPIAPVGGHPVGDTPWGTPP